MKSRGAPKVRSSGVTIIFPRACVFLRTQNPGCERITACLPKRWRGQRGYLLTGGPEYLDIYRVATGAMGPAIAELKEAIIDPAQQQAVAEVEPLVERKFAELDEIARLFGEDKSDEAVALVRSGVGRDLMTEIRARSLKILATEQHIVGVRSSNSSSKIGWLLAVNLVGLALIIVLFVVSILVMRRLAGKELAYVGELERSNQELDDFAYIASHDLKEPLRGLFNHASFLLEDYKDTIDEDGVRRLARLGQRCQRMERLINDLMYFSRLERADLAVQETDPNAVVVEIQHMMETLLGETPCTDRGAAHAAEQPSARVPGRPHHRRRVVQTANDELPLYCWWTTMTWLSS
jgi:CHASE3 domain sensor protein